MVDICLMTKPDLPNFVSLWNQGYEVLTSNKIKMTLQKAYQGFEAKTFKYLGIFVNNHLQGFDLLKEKENSLWLKHILIDKKQRNKKLGSLLLKKIEKMFQKEYKSIKTEVLKENIPALNFFLKNGYKIIKYDALENQYVLEKHYASKV